MCWRASKASGYAACLSTVMTLGSMVWLVPSTFQKNRSTASALRRHYGWHQHEGYGGTYGVDRSVEILPVLFDTDVRLVHTVAIIGRFERRSTPLIQLWRTALDPAKLRRVVDLYAASRMRYAIVR
jgi:hypothetical protein